ncbi:sigma-70 family RNA polymerase sigma factor [Endozoicomonas ascidiicola]|uniref:sigma-70 family RNA polymerase sigma factor n=1 Tax=Endozoicomonas ascidiicola TaxID=1698521 RepID=UPI000AB97C56|nr:RNA polymerase sigma factor FliA [Endozoicomonas ascidiicola]
MQSSLAWYDQAALGAYRSVQSVNGPEQRILAHAGMVKRVALHLHDRIGGELDDLIQNGMIGLLEAAHRYDETTGVPFEAFALPRVRGAIVDQFRRDDWCPRTLRQQGGAIRKAREAFVQRHGREPVDSELAAETGLSTEELREHTVRLESSSICSLDALQLDGFEPEAEGDDLTQAPLMKQRRQKRLAELLKQLPEREQQILYLYYQEMMNLKEIAAVLELTEARISQLRKKALDALRQPMSEWND